jgi:phospholipase C
MMMENWSFDSLFGTMENVNGLSKASQTATTQLDLNDVPYTTLPQTQPNVPTDLPNMPFDLSPFINFTSKTEDLTHSFYAEQLQINSGKMNKFAAYSSAKGLAMSYYDMKNTYLGQLARNYTVFDNWYHAL